MALLKEEITNRGIEGTFPSPNDETPIQDLDPVALLELQSMFGELIHESPRLVQLVNRTAPALFAMLLFTTGLDFQVSEDGEEIVATRNTFEAEQEAIGMVRSVAAAWGKMEGEVSVDPSDAEVDEDTDLVAVR